MNASLPTGFFLSFAGAVVGAGLVLWMLARLLARLPWRNRLAGLVAGERGSAIVEFPFVIIVLIQVTLWTWQLAFICTAYLVVDYAAYATARVASVTIPKDWAEPAGTLNKTELGGVAGFRDAAELKESLKSYIFENKARDLRWTAAFVCFPIAGAKTGGTTTVSAGAAFGEAEFGASASLPWPDAVERFLGNHDFLARFLYTGAYTSVAIDPAPPISGGRYTFDEGGRVSVLVTHQFSLRVPFASWLFRSGTHPAPDSDGYTAVTGRASMMLESGDEAEPPEPPPEGDAKKP